MFQELRRKDKSLSEADSKQILEKGLYGVLGTISKSGYAYTIPLNYVYHKNNIYFHCATAGHKLENVQHNNRVSFTVVENCQIVPVKFTAKFRSVIVFGKISFVKNDDEKLAGLQLLTKKYAPKFQKEVKEYIQSYFNKVVLLKLQIEKITGKGNA
jgi:hypothetical protein